jgi:DNA helicase TIP49 (TBP-interacting protein)
MDMGWTKYQSDLEKTEMMKCETMRRAFGLVVSSDSETYDCTCCELAEKCGLSK